MWEKKLLSTFFVLVVSIVSLLSQTLEIPVITNVSVDKNSQKTIITWSMNNPAIVDGYIILRQIFGQVGVVDGSYNTIVTINNKNQFTYLDNGIDYGTANPGAGIENYRVASFKIVGGITEYSNMSETASTFYLSPVSFDLCYEQNTLNWSPYSGFGSNLSGYKIYYSNTPLGAPVLLSQVGSNQTSFVHKQVMSNIPYYYYIEALNSSTSAISSSNMQLINTTMPAAPQLMYANFGTVDIANEVNLSFTVDANAVINSYYVLKSSQKDGNYDTIAKFPKGSSSINYSDIVKTDKEIAYYKVVAINTCGIKSHESNLAHNIVLEALPNAQPEESNNLKWNTYEGWTSGVLKYTIYRSIDENPFQELAVVSSLINSYNDDISQFKKPEINGQPTNGHFCYYIVAQEASGNSTGSLNESKSNISCAEQETVAFIPNAINPNSHIDANRTFKPVISFVNDYKLIIYNRWGEIVFQSSDPLMGWDGRFNGGELLKRGTYVYILKYKSKDNKLVEKSGQINLVY